MKRMAFVQVFMFIGLALFFSSGRPAHALIYDYTGNTFTRVDDPSFGLQITATVDFYDTILTPNFTGTFSNPGGNSDNAWRYIRSITLSCGSFTFLPDLMQGSYVSFTFVDGQITNWLIDSPYLTLIPNSIEHLYSSLGNEFIEYRGSGVYGYNSNFNDPGQWAIRETSAPVPEPSTMLLLGSGLAGLAGLRMRRASKT